ncbi:hypothetical protein B7463_g2335, partial [Scytalidium lignicola]
MVPGSSGAEPCVISFPSPSERAENSPISSVADRRQVAEAQTTLDDVLHMMQNTPAHEPKISKILLTGLMGPDRAGPTPKLRERQPLREENQIISSVAEGLSLPTNPLPDRKAAECFIRAYFEYANFSSPLLHEPTFRRKLEHAYAEVSARQTDTAIIQAGDDLKLDVFFVNMVFAIGLLALQKQDSSTIPTLLCDRYCETALMALNEVGFPNNIEGVQALILLAEYSYLHPTDLGGWDTIGLALRRAVELGLHEDPPVGTIDCLTLDIMRRTFWVAYSLDRSLAIAMGRPTCLSDSVITAKFPSNVNDEYITADGIINTESIALGKKRYSIHWFKYRRLQSEIRTVLYENPLPIFPAIDYADWQTAMQQRIQQWYDEVRQENRRSEAGIDRIRLPEMRELTFRRALVLLYRPSPKIPVPSTQGMLELASSSAYVINLYRRFHLENKLFLFWQAIENLFEAGTALMYCYVNASLVRERFTLRLLESLIHSTSTVLWGLVERFPALKGKRDAFDVIASKTLADLGKQNSQVDIADTSSTLNQLREHFKGSEPRNDMIENSTLLENGLDITPGINLTANGRLLSPSTGKSVANSGGDTNRDHRQLQGNPLSPSINDNSGIYLYPDFDELSMDWEAFNSTSQLPSSMWDWES